MILTVIVWVRWAGHVPRVVEKVHISVYIRGFVGEI